MARLLVALVCAYLTTTVGASLRLELSRLEAKASSLATVRRAIAPVRWRQGWHVTEYRIGDPPQPVQSIIDVGSGLVWTQSATCPPRCISQDLDCYNPDRSRSAHSVPCDNRTLCAAAHAGRCTGHNAACTIMAKNGAEGIELWDLAGDLGVDVFTFGSEKVTIAFGRMREIKLFKPEILGGASGVIGLGKGPLSLVSQLGHTKFSYCFTEDVNATSHLVIGSSAVLGDGPVTSIPFVVNPSEEPYNTLYYVPLIGLSVGNVRLAIPTAAFNMRRASPWLWTGGTIIDSCIETMFLVDVAYKALRQEVARQMDSSLLPTTSEWPEYCVDRWDVGAVPPLVLHFGDGADLVLPATNYWMPLADDRTCMVVYSSAERNTTLPMNETTVIGSYMQQDMHVLYDIGKGEISFQAAHCSSM
uniref:Aspartic proteinase nepenthesin-1 n=1 Tax=Aegilops tauschii TaxID=37682 RepID=R7WES1_AEGTA